MAEIKKEEVIDWLSSQSVLEIADLVKELEDKWGVSAAAPVAAVAVAPGAPRRAVVSTASGADSRPNRRN